MSFFSIKTTGRLIEDVKKLAKEFETVIDKQTANKVGQLAIKEIKDRIAGGVSPIKGGGRFAGYKNPDKYPGDRKGKRPVNLKLSGHMLSQLKYQSIKEGNSGYVVDIAYTENTDENGSSAADKERGHREGVYGQPKRPSIPTEAGEELRTDINNKIRDIFNSRIQELIKKVNNG